MMIPVLAALILASSGPASAVTGVATTPTVEYPTIRLARTSCLGTCPVYTVTIDPEGKVTFVGELNTEAKGTRTSRISGADVEFLHAAVKRLPFDDLQPRYATVKDGCAGESTGDLPSIEITVSTAKTSKTVRYDLMCEGPAIYYDLLWLARTIDHVSRSRQWIGEQ